MRVLLQQIAAVAAAAGGAQGIVPPSAPMPNLFDTSKPDFSLLDILVRGCVCTGLRN